MSRRLMLGSLGAAAVAAASALYLVSIPGLDGSRQLPRVPGNALVNHLFELEAAGRVHRLLALEEVGRELVGLQDSGDPLVPLREELGVLALLHDKGAQVHEPVEAI